MWSRLKSVLFGRRAQPEGASTSVDAPFALGVDDAISDDAEAIVFLVVGLGNPGKKYDGTRHNVGFAVIDELARRAGVHAFQGKFKGDVATGQLGGERCAILKPLTYMNVSGESVQPAAAFYKIEPTHVIVVHDELDLPLGELKMKKGGGHGGHNGIRSIAQRLGTPDFVRVRAGIGRPEGKRDVSNYVLGQFSDDQRADADLLIQKAADAMELVIREGLLAAQHKYHTKKKKKPKVKTVKPRVEGAEGAEANPGSDGERPA